MTREWIRSETVLFFRWFFLPKKVIWKNHPSVATTTDCFEPIFGFLRSFWFEKYRSASWRRIGMFSELSGRSALIIFKILSIASSVLIRKVGDFSIYESTEETKRPMAWANSLNQTLPISRDMAHDEREEAVTRDTLPLKKLKWYIVWPGYF